METTPPTKRRRFAASEKLRLLKAAEAALASGERGALEALLRKEAMPQARAGFQTVLADYSQGRGELTVAVTAERQVRDVELRLLQAQLDAQVELAAIERLIGGDL